MLPACVFFARVAAAKRSKMPALRSFDYAARQSFIQIMQAGRLSVRRTWISNECGCKAHRARGGVHVCKRVGGFCSEDTHGSRALVLRPCKPRRPAAADSQVSGSRGLQQRFANRAAVAQLVARRSHNPKVVSSILTCRIFQNEVSALAMANLSRRDLADFTMGTRRATHDEEKRKPIRIAEGASARG